MYDPVTRIKMDAMICMSNFRGLRMEHPDYIQNLEKLTDEFLEKTRNYIRRTSRLDDPEKLAEKLLDDARVYYACSPGKLA